jgi:LuxR family maltose regulon positive regulatory protein
VLRARFAQGWPELLPTLHTRAAAWLEQNGLPEPAIRHALVGGDVERAARLVEQQARPMMIRGELATLVAWAEALPEQVYRVRPRLLAERAMALTFSGNVREAQPLLEQLEQTLPGTGPGPAVRHLRGLIAIQRALVAELGGQDERVLALASAADKWLPADDFLARALIPYLRGRAHAAGGDLDAAEAAFRELVEISRLGNNIWTMSVAASELARVLKIRGRLRQAAEVYEQVLRLAEARGARQFAPLAVIEIGQADLLCEWNALEQARTLAETALGRAERWGNAGGRMYVRLHLACILLAQRDWAAMQRVLEQADDLRGQVPVLPEHGRQWMDLQVRLWLAQGRLDQARQWAETLDGAPAGPVYMRDAEQATLARVWLAHGYGARAAAILAEASGGAEAGGRVRALIELKALRALALGQAGQPGPAGGELMDSLRLARPEGFLRVFLDEGEPMHRLLADLKGQLGRRPRRGETGDERQLLGYVDYLLAGFRKPAGGATTTSAPPMAAGRQTRAGKPSPLVEPLSARELEVLRLVDQGLSNREMADRLVVSLSTVKKHVENIHAKLGVHSRTQALARARELELL